MENGGCYVGEDAVGDLGCLVVGDVNEGHGVEGVCGVGRAVGVDSIVGIAVVGDDDDLVVACGLGCLDYFLNALVYGCDGFLNSLVDASVAYHVAVGEVDNDEMVLILLDGCHELVLDLEGAHLGLEVVGGYLG